MTGFHLTRDLSQSLVGGRRTNSNVVDTANIRGYR